MRSTSEQQPPAAADRAAQCPNCLPLTSQLRDEEQLGRGVLRPRVHLRPPAVLVRLVLDEAVQQHLELLELLRHARRAAPRRDAAVVAAVVVPPEAGVVPVKGLPREAHLRHVRALQLRVRVPQADAGARPAGRQLVHDPLRH
jgi:hypothetical protein